MRRDVDRLLTQLETQHKEWLLFLAAERMAFDAERERWEAERKVLLNAAISETSGEFAQRQKATEEHVIIDREPAEPRPQIIGM